MFLEWYEIYTLIWITWLISTRSTLNYWGNYIPEGETRSLGVTITITAVSYILFPLATLFALFTRKEN